MFSKCNYIFGIISTLDISDEDKIKLSTEINSLVNLIMFGDENRPVTVNDIRNIHEKTREFYNYGESNV